MVDDDVALSRGSDCYCAMLMITDLFKDTTALVFRHVQCSDNLSKDPPSLITTLYKYKYIKLALNIEILSYFEIL